MKALRLTFAVLLVASLGIVGAALLSQYVGGLQPCELCLYQRWPYYAVIGIAPLGLLLAGKGRAAAWLLGLCALLFAADAGLAFYHVGVEQHWIAGPTACTAATGQANSLEALRAQILAQQPVRCDEPQWALFGVTMAGWNGLAASCLAVFALRGVLTRRRPAQAFGRLA
jgi:disulfide bond formation protein DsbB